MQARLLFKLTGLGVALSLLGACAALAGSGNTSYATADQKFCNGAPAHDYTLPFSKMPPASPLPHSGKLSFLPENVHLAKPNQATLVLGGARDLAYDLSIASGVTLSRRLDLEASAWLSEVNARGKPLRVVQRASFRAKTKNPDKIDGQQLSLKLPSKVGFFRVNLDFARTNGTRLGRYQEYFRSVRPTIRTKLEVARDIVGIGDRLNFKVANPGTESIAFGQEFRVEAWNEGRWAPVDLQLGPWQRVRLGLGSGEAGKCQSFVIPDALEPNRSYRLAKHLLRPSMTISSDKFTVVP